MFVNELSTSITTGPSFYEMKDGYENRTDSEDLDDLETEEEEDDCNSKSTEGALIQEYDGNKGREAEDNEEDDLKFLLELEDVAKLVQSKPSTSKLKKILKF